MKSVVEYSLIKITRVKKVANTTKRKKKPNPHEGHRERLKETYLKNGVDGLHLHVVLELLLFFGIPYKDTNEIAHELINKFGSFSGVLEADYAALKNTKNMTHNAALLIRLVSDIARLYYVNKLSKNEVFNTRKKVGKYLFQKYLGLSEETVYLLLFDKYDHIINCVKLSTGIHSASEVNTGKIVKMANLSNVSKVAISHNHPDNSGVSSNDLITYNRLAYYLNISGITLYDSYIITSKKAISTYETANSVNNQKRNDKK